MPVVSLTAEQGLAEQGTSRRLLFQGQDANPAAGDLDSGVQGRQD